MKYKVLLVTNYWSWLLTDPLSFLIRWVTDGPNHAAIRQISPAADEVHEMIGSTLWWCFKKAIGPKWRKYLNLELSFEANKGCGYIVTPYVKWLKKANRYVTVYDCLVSVELPELTEGYGYFDLPQYALHYLRKDLKIGNSWNGYDGVRLWPGVVCHEYVLMALKSLARVFAPKELALLPELVWAEEFKTQKA